MKKLMMLLAFAGLSTVAMAQETTTEIPTKKGSVVTNGFWDNWFIGVGGEWMTNYGSQETSSIGNNPFSLFRGNGGINVHVGKWATPSFGMRVKTDFAWGRTVWTDDNDWNPLYKQLSISLQPMVNLHNLFAGYKPRVWNTIVYASAGYQRNFDAESNSPVFGGGWLNQFNITKRFHIDLDIWTHFGDCNMDGAAEYEGNKLLINSRDWQLGWSLGVGVNLGKVGWDNAPDVDAIMAMNKAQLDALNAALADQQAENARLKDLLAKKPKETVKTISEFASTSASVFFNLNKSKIASKKDLVNVKELAEYAKANGKTVVVTGYADSKTGSPAYNQSLSMARANTVADQLVSMGVSRDKIEIAAKGGVNDLAPFSYNRRAVVTLK